MSSSSTTRGPQRPLVARARKSSRSSAVRGRYRARRSSARSVFGVVGGVGEGIVGLQVVRGDVQVADIRAIGKLDGNRGLLARAASLLLEPVGDGVGRGSPAAQGQDQRGIGLFGAVVGEQPLELRGGARERESALEG